MCSSPLIHNMVDDCYSLFQKSFPGLGISLRG